MFLFRLALALGRTVAELEASLSQRELLEWAEFYSIDPFGGFRADIQTGILSTVIASVIGGNKRAKPSDFMPLQKVRVSAEQSREQLARQAHVAFMQAMGGRKLTVIKGSKKRRPHGVAR